MNADPSLRRAHMIEGTFTEVAAHTFKKTLRYVATRHNVIVTDKTFSQRKTKPTK